MRALRSGVRLLLRVRSKKRVLHQRIKEEKHRLRPGLWLIMDARVARHWRHRDVPHHLKRTKVDQARGLYGVVYRIAGWILPPLASWVRPRQGTGSSRIFLCTSSDDAVLVDPDARIVLRSLKSSTVSNSYIELRNRLSRHLDAPRFEVLSAGRVIREELIEGVPFADLDVDARLPLAEVLWSRYDSLCREAGDGTSTSLVVAALDAASRVMLPEAFRLWLEQNGDSLIEHSEKWPVVPSHGGLRSQDIVVNAGSPWVIDFELVGVLPFFHDPTHLVIHEAEFGRSDLLDALVEGRLATAATNGGAAAPAFLMATVLVGALHRTRVWGSFRQEWFARSLNAHWVTLSGVLHGRQ